MLLFGRNPACSSDIISSALLFSLFRIIRSNTLLAWQMRLIVLWVWHCLEFPFFGMGVIRDCVHFWGHCLESQILWQMCVNTCIVSCPPCFQSSAGMSSMPGDFPVFRLLTASLGKPNPPPLDYKHVQTPHGSRTGDQTVGEFLSTIRFYPSQ